MTITVHLFELVIIDGENVLLLSLRYGLVDRKSSALIRG